MFDDWWHLFILQTDQYGGSLDQKLYIKLCTDKSVGWTTDFFKKKMHELTEISVIFQLKVIVNATKGKNFNKENWVTIPA